MRDGVSTTCSPVPLQQRRREQKRETQNGERQVHCVDEAVLDFNVVVVALDVHGWEKDGKQENAEEDEDVGGGRGVKVSLLDPAVENRQGHHGEDEHAEIQREGDEKPAPQGRLSANPLLSVDGHLAAQVQLDRGVDDKWLKRRPHGEDGHVDCHQDQDYERQFPVGEVLPVVIGPQEHQVEPVILDKQGAEDEYDPNVFEPHDDVAEEEVDKVAA